MKKYFYLVTFCVTNAVAQPYFNKYVPVQFNAAVEVQQLANNDYLLVTSPFPGWNIAAAYSIIHIIRMNEEGNIIFNKKSTFTTSSDYLNTYASIELPGGDLLFAGSLNTASFFNPLIIYKTTANGNLIWAKRVEITSGASISFGVTKLYFNSNGNITLAGSYQAPSPLLYGLYFMEIDISGNLVSDHLVKGDQTSIRNRGFKESNGDYVWPHNNFGVVIVDSNYVKKNYFSVSFNNTIIPSVKKLIKGYNNDYIMVFSVVDNVNGGMFDAALACFDSLGQYKWMHRYLSPDNDYAYDIIPTANNTYTMSVIKSNIYPHSSILLTVDINGNLLNTSQHINGGFFTFKQIGPNKILAGGYLDISGQDDYFSSITVTNNSFQNLCLSPYTPFVDSLLVPSGVNTGTCINQTPNPGIILINYNFILNTASGSAMDLCFVSSVIENTNNERLNLFPNPTGEVLNIVTDLYFDHPLIEIHEITGKRVYLEKVNSDFISGSVNLSLINPGIYFITISDKNLKTTRKFIKQ